jgi:hypothetical protein
MTIKLMSVDLIDRGRARLAWEALVYIPSDSSPRWAAKTVILIMTDAQLIKI